ncbi:30S ribosomal protein S6 [Candidatus Daviesbacteria bacterium]|nr:30S ribosomal protein S6 [Candidatus Daviesbacteria bacterium]
MPVYTLTMLLKNDLDDKKRQEVLDGIKGKLSDGLPAGRQGEIFKEDLWGSKNLAYKIQHQDKAYFVHLEFETEPASISSLDKMVKLNEDIIRYLLLRKD